MSAQPAAEHDPDDPVAILRALPGHYHQQFLAEYRAAAEAAREPGSYQALQALLRLWRLRAVAYSDPRYDEALAEGREAARTGRSHEGSVPIEDIVPDWPQRLARKREP
jgi:hypothetical protein